MPIGLLGTETRKSTSGGVITFGKHYINSWSKTQAIVELSSAESELYGLVKCVSETLEVKSALFDFGILVGGVIKSDASAALGIIQRQGLGKLRHVETKYCDSKRHLAIRTQAFFAPRVSQVPRS